MLPKRTQDKNAQYYKNKLDIIERNSCDLFIDNTKNRRES